MGQINPPQLGTISQFKSKLRGGGARPNLFECQVTFPDSVVDNLQGDDTGVASGSDSGASSSGLNKDEFRFLCKATSLPASNVANIDIPFRGRTLKVAGDRTFDPWSITVINDEDFNAYRNFQNWMQNIAQYGDSSGFNNPAAYAGQATVYQLGRIPSVRQGESENQANSRVIAQYRMADIWPSTVSNIDLSYDSSDAIEEFTVDFQVNYWYPEKAPNTGL
tara:strand:+ start:431 stop:1093 length:663 start_codon:yes stop_codon:yes gene_type:complete